MSPPVLILIVEPDTERRIHWQRVIAKAFPYMTVGVEAVTGAAKALQALQHRPCYLALVDLDLPDGDGFELIARVHDQTPAVHLIATANAFDERRFCRALRAGAEGCLLKDDEESDLIQRLSGTARGIPALSPRLIKHLIRLSLNTPPRDPAACLPPHDDLTARERQVLTVLASGMRVKEVARKFGVSPNTVQTHVKRLYSKLNVSTRAQATVAATRIGLI